MIAIRNGILFSFFKLDSETFWRGQNGSSGLFILGLSYLEG